jgi:hypothetical protein
MSNRYILSSDIVRILKYSDNVIEVRDLKTELLDLCNNHRCFESSRGFIKEINYI